MGKLRALPHTRSRKIYQLTKLLNYQFRSILTQHADHSSLQSYGFCRNDDRLHGGIRWLQANVHAFAIQTLERGIIPFHPRIASMAFGEGPSGFSFEASLMIASG